MKWHPWHPHTYAVNTSSERMFDEPRSWNLEVQGFQNLARWLRQAEQASFSGREDPERSLCTLVLLKANLLMCAATPNFYQNTSNAQEANVERRIRLCEQSVQWLEVSNLAALWNFRKLRKQWKAEPGEVAPALGEGLLVTKLPVLCA